MRKEQLDLIAKFVSKEILTGVDGGLRRAVLALLDDRNQRLAILRRYHGGDGTVTREDVVEALSITLK